MGFEVSPLAPAHIVAPPPVAGVRLATAQAGFAYEYRTDVLMCAFDGGTSVAGVFTQSMCPSAAVDWCKAIIGAGTARALVVNSGNANAFTGLKGKKTAERTAKLAAETLGCSPDEVLLASTGVIGEPLDADKFAAVMDRMAARLGPENWRGAAEAIMTTDTYPKVAAQTVMIDGVEVTITGIAKGSGMIAPDMATMLCFVFTDMAIDAPVLQTLLADAVKPSFNAITVDSDTSTSDTLLVFATGKAAERGLMPLTSAGDPRAAVFAKALTVLLKDLAGQVVRDGEGATKLIRVRVNGAADNGSARRIALSVANSPLVKTAIAGEDANWGRVVMAVGKAGEPADRDRLRIAFGEVVVAIDGERVPGYSEEEASAYMKHDEIDLNIDIGLGAGKAMIMTCDLTHGYISINADYRS